MLHRMSRDDMQIETPAQWMEHSDAWRYEHLDLAPSELLRREALAAHDRLEETPLRRRSRLPLLTGAQRPRRHPPGNVNVP
jgi:hypothetical protein